MTSFNDLNDSQQAQVDRIAARLLDAARLTRELDTESHSVLVQTLANQNASLRQDLSEVTGLLLATSTQYAGPNLDAVPFESEDLAGPPEADQAGSTQRTRPATGGQSRYLKVFLSYQLALGDPVFLTVAKVLSIGPIFLCILAPSAAWLFGVPLDVFPTVTLLMMWGLGFLAGVTTSLRTIGSPPDSGRATKQTDTSGPDSEQTP